MKFETYKDFLNLKKSSKISQFEFYYIFNFVPISIKTADNVLATESRESLFVPLFISFHKKSTENHLIVSFSTSFHQTGIEKKKSFRKRLRFHIQLRSIILESKKTHKSLTFPIFTPFHQIGQKIIYYPNGQTKFFSRFFLPLQKLKSASALKLQTKSFLHEKNFISNSLFRKLKDKPPITEKFSSGECFFTSAYLTAASTSTRESTESSAFFDCNVLAISIRARSSSNFERSVSISFSIFVCSSNCDCLSSYWDDYRRERKSEGMQLWRRIQWIIQQGFNH